MPNCGLMTSSVAQRGSLGIVDMFLEEIDSLNLVNYGLQAWKNHVWKCAASLGTWNSYHRLMDSFQTGPADRASKQLRTLVQVVKEGNLYVPSLDEDTQILVWDGLLKPKLAKGAGFRLSIPTPFLLAVMVQAIMQSSERTIVCRPEPPDMDNTRALAVYLLESVIQSLSLKDMVNIAAGRSDRRQPREWILQLEAGACLKSVLRGTMHTSSYMLVPELRPQLGDSNVTESGVTDDSFSDSFLDNSFMDSLLTESSDDSKTRLDHLVFGRSPSGKVQRIGLEYVVAAGQKVLTNHVERSVQYASGCRCYMMCVNLKIWTPAGRGTMSDAAKERQMDSAPEKLLGKFPKFGETPSQVQGVNVLLQPDRERAYIQYGDDGPVTTIDLQPVEQELTILPAAFQEQQRQRDSTRLALPSTRQAAARHRPLPPAAILSSSRRARVPAMLLHCPNCVHALRLRPRSMGL